VVKDRAPENSWWVDVVFIAIPNFFPFILSVMIIFIFLINDACLDVLCHNFDSSSVIRSLSWFSFIAGYKAGEKRCFFC
jgi:hypothetical protein